MSMSEVLRQLNKKQSMWLFIAPNRSLMVDEIAAYRCIDPKMFRIQLGKR